MEKTEKGRGVMTRKVAVEMKVAEGRTKVAEAKRKTEERTGREIRGEEDVPVKSAEEEMMDGPYEGMVIHCPMAHVSSEFSSDLLGNCEGVRVWDPEST